MASTFENDLRLEEIGTGEQSGTWGATTNTNLELIAEAFSYGTEAITTNADDHATVVADGSTDEGRSMYLKYTGSLDSTCTITISAGSAGTFTLSKVWLIENATSGGQDIIITSGSGASITIKNGQVKMVASDGAGSGGIMYDLLQDVAIPDLFVDDDLTLQSDGAVLGFGADTDVTLTHVADTGLLLNAAMKLQFRDSAISIRSSADATLDLAADGDINLTAGVDINIPSGVGLTFGDDGEKIEGDGTDLTISGNNINLTATADVNIPSGVGLTFATAEKIESDGTDLSITVGSGGDINIPANIGLTFGDDGEKIEGDGTDLTIAGNNINLTAVADVNIPSGVGLTFATAEKIESDGTDLSITVGSGGDINIPANIGVTFGDDGEKIEGDGTDLTITGNNINLTATADVIIPANVGITFGTGEKIEGDSTDLTITSGAKINLTATSDVVIPSGVGLILDGSGNEKIESDGTDISISVGSGGDINIPANIGVTFGNDGEKIEGDGTDLTITGNNINLTATADVIIPANVGITFGTGEKIEGDSTDLTITSGAKINLTATSDVVIPSGVGLILDGSGDEKIESDGTDISISVGSNGDINIPSNIGLTFGDDGEKIEGDGTDLTISGNNINLTATADVNIPSGVGLTFATGEKIESDGTDLTITVGSGGDINIPANIGLTFGDDGEKIEGDGSDLTISGNSITLSGNTTVTGNFTVNGTTTTVNTTNLTVTDPLVKYGQTYTGTAYDQGFVVTRGNGSATNIANRAFIWDESADEFVTANTNTEDGTTAGNVTIDDYANLHVGKITADDASVFNAITASGILKTDDTTEATSTTDGSLQTDGGLSVVKDAVFGDDVKLLSDDAVLSFGAGSDVTITHDPDDGLIFKSIATADDNPFLLTIQTGETDLAANDVIGKIQFQAPDEGTGTDANLVSAAIQAVAEGDFSSSSNATSLQFMTGSSEAAATKMTLSSAGVLDVDGGITVDNITIDGTEIDLSSGDLTIDVAGDISLDADGGDIRFKDGGVEFGTIYNTSSNLGIASINDNKDIIFQGFDDTNLITALTLDMSEAGDAQFNRNVGIGGTPNNYSGYSALTLNHATNGGLIDLELNGNLKGEMFLSSSGFHIKSMGSDEDLLFQGNDGGSAITALTLDMSQAGEADFNSAIKVSGSIVAHQTNKGVLEYSGNVFMMRSYGANNGDGVISFRTAGGGGSTDSEAARFDNAGSLLIGTTTEGVAGGENLTIGDSGEGGITIRTGDSSKGNIYFSDGTSGDAEYEGIIRYDHNGDYMTFATASTHRMRIDSSGNVGIGTDAPSDYNSAAHNLVLYESGGSGMTLASGTSGQGAIYFADGTSGDAEYRGYIIYEHGSNDHMRFGTGGAEHMRIDSNGKVGIGITPLASTTGNGLGAAFSTLAIKASDTVTQALSIDATNAAGPNFMISSYSDGSGSYYMLGANLLLATDGSVAYETNGENMSGIMLDSRGGQGIQFYTAAHDGSSYVPAERMRIDSSGNVGIGTTNTSLATQSSDVGVMFTQLGRIYATTTDHHDFNMVDDGEIFRFRSAATQEGSISVSGSTVSYNGFSGTHESSGINTNTAIGTVVSTIDELDTYPDHADFADERTKSRLDHAKVKVSDVVGDKRVYGIVTRFDQHDKVFIASVGIGSVKVTGACEGGDLLESNGDGTAKVQSDDIIRSKTIGKVTIGNNTSSVKLVSCVLYCG